MINSSIDSCFLLGLGYLGSSDCVGAIYIEVIIPKGVHTLIIIKKRLLPKS